MPELVLLRHAQAESPQPGADDSARALTEAGRGQAQAAGKALQELGFKPGYVITSTAVRAQETAHIVCQALGVSLDSLAICPPIYQEGLKGLYQAMDEYAEGEQVLLVGHNPALERFAGWLEGVGTVPLGTGDWVRYAIDEDWSRLSKGRARRIG